MRQAAADEFALRQENSELRSRIAELEKRLHSKVSNPLSVSPGAHYLQRELYERIGTDDQIRQFIQTGGSDGFWYLDLENPRERWVSPRWREVLGYADSTATSSLEWWQSTIFPEDIPLTDRPGDHVVRFRHQDGSPVWVRCRTVVVKDKAGRPVRMLGAHTDVTAVVRECCPQVADLETVLETLPGAVLVSNDCGQVVFANLSARGMFGIETMAGLPVPTLIREAPGGTVAVRGDGTQIAIQVTRNRLRIGDGVMDVVVLTDLSEPTTLEEERGRFDKIANASPCLISIFQLWPDGSTALPYVSPGMQEIWGFDAEEVRHDASKVVERIHPEDQAAALASIRVSVETMSEWRADFRVLHPRKGEIFVEGIAKPEPGPDGSTIWYGVLSDVTARKQAEQTLAQREREHREREDKLRFALNAAQVGTWDWNVRTGQIDWSSHTRRLFGVEPGVLMTRDLSLAVIHPEDRDRVRQAIRGALEAGAECDVDMRVSSATGSARWVSFRGQAVCGEDGIPRRMAGVALDITDRKLAEAQVSEWKNRYEAAVLASNQLLYDWDSTSDRVVYGGELKGILGSEPGESAGDLADWLEAVHPEDRAAFRSEIARVIQTRTPFVLEYRLIRRDGSVIHVRDNGHFILDGEGRAGRMIGFVTDVTAHKRALHALRESEEGFRLLSEMVPQLVWTRLPDGTCDYANARWTEYTGVRAEVGASWTDRLHPDDRGRAAEAWRIAVEQGGGFDGEFRLLGRDGKYRWFKTRAFALKDDAGRILKWYGTDTDIHDLHNTEQALRENEERFRTLLNGMAPLAWMAGGDGRIFWFSDRWFEFTGMTEQEAERSGWQTVQDPELAEGERRRWEASIRKGEAFELELQLRGRDGGYRTFLTRVRPLKDNEGKVWRWLGTFSDITEKREVEGQLRHVLAERSLALEAAGLQCWEYRFHGQPWGHGTFAWDGGYGALYGFKGVNEVPFNELVNRIHPEDRVRAAQAAGMATGGKDEGSYHSEHRVIWPDGSLHWIASHGRVLWQGDGASRTPVRFVGVSMETTARKNSEEELRQNRERLELIYEALHLGAWDWNLHTGKDAWSPGLWRLHGLSPEIHRPCFETWRMTVHPEDLPGCEQTINDAVASGGRFETEWRRATPGCPERWLWSRGRPILDADGRPGRYVGVVLDITERKQAEQAIRRNEELYRTMTRSIPGGLVTVVDPELRYTALDGELLGRHGHDAEQFLGKTVREVLDPVLVAHSEELYRRALAGDTTSEDREYRGRTFWTQYVPLRDQSGRVTGAMSLWLDIDDRKAAEQALTESREELRRLNAELDQRVRERTIQLEASNKELEAFAYSVSHDLRAPLRGIDGWSLALKEDFGGQLEQEALEYLNRVRGEAQRMGQLIDDLLQLSRITRSLMRHSEVDLTLLAKRVAQRLIELEPRRQIEFVIEPDVTATGDSRLIEIALENLLGNAVKYSAPREWTRIEFGTITCSGERTFFVRDNGVGFDMAYADKLFGAFQRLHRTSDFPGTGIGLATVQRVIHRHGGRVWAEAQPDQGAIFYFTLPVGS